jgi:hypothetical protein
MSDFAKQAAENKLKQKEFQRKSVEVAKAQAQKIESRLAIFWGEMKQYAADEVTTWNDVMKDKDDAETINFQGSNYEAIADKTQKRVRLKLFLDTKTQHISYELIRTGDVAPIEGGALKFQVQDGTLKALEGNRGFAPQGCARLLMNKLFEA